MKSFPNDEIDDDPAQKKGSDKFPLKAAKILNAARYV